MRYIRFICDDEENGHDATGIVTTARALLDMGDLYDYEEELLEEHFEWLNDNLPCPPFSASLQEGTWSPHAVAWFKETAQEFVECFWNIVAILEEHDVPVRVLKTERPGKVLYEDEFQVVAEAYRRDRI